MVKWPLPRPNHTLPPKKLESWIAVIPPWSDACIHCTISMPAASTPLSEEYDIVRLLAQKEDFERRIAERDERNTDLQRKLSKAETRAREASEALVAERAERQLADKVSEREIKSLKKQLEKQQAEAKEVIADLEGRGHRATEKIATLAQAQREALEQLATSKAQIESIRAEVVRAESSVDELRAERAHAPRHLLSSCHAHRLRLRRRCHEGAWIFMGEVGQRHEASGAAVEAGEEGIDAVVRDAAQFWRQGLQVLLRHLRKRGT